MKRALGIVLALALLASPALAQRQHGGGGGGGQHQGAPAAQSRPAPPPQAQQQHQAPPPQGARQAPPQSYDRGHAQPRPMPPAYNQGHRGYGPPPPVYRPGYGYRPRGYYPYGGYAAPYGYGYAYPYYPSVGLSVGPGGWALGGVYGGISVFYEKQTIEQSSAQVEEVQGPAYLTFEVDAVNAEVYVDGAYQGVVEHFTQNPLELAAGEHKVELRLNGDKVGAFKIKPGVGQTVRIRAKLLG